MIRLSIAFQTNKSLAEYGALAEEVEAFGFDTISVYNDLFFQPAWLPLLAIAQNTHHIRLGPAAVNPFTCHPINIAANIALIDEASMGRAYLGIARGAWLDALGIIPERPVTAVHDALECIRYLLQRETSGYESEIFPLPKGESFRWPTNQRRIPILLGTWGERLITATANLVDEIKLGGTANPALARLMRQRIERIATDKAIGLVVGAVTVIDEDRQTAETLARREVALYLPVVASLDLTYQVDPEEMTRVKNAVASGDWSRAGQAISHETLRRFAFFGTPSDIAKQVTELAEAGVTRIEFGTPHGVDEVNAIRLLGNHVLPAFS